MTGTQFALFENPRKCRYQCMAWDAHEQVYCCCSLSSCMRSVYIQVPRIGAHAFPDVVCRLYLCACAQEVFLGDEQGYIDIWSYRSSCLRCTTLLVPEGSSILKLTYNSVSSFLTICTPSSILVSNELCQFVTFSVFLSPTATCPRRTDIHHLEQTAVSRVYATHRHYCRFASLSHGRRRSSAVSCVRQQDGILECHLRSARPFGSWV